MLHDGVAVDRPVGPGRRKGVGQRVGLVPHVDAVNRGNQRTSRQGSLIHRRQNVLGLGLKRRTGRVLRVHRPDVTVVAKVEDRHLVFVGVGCPTPVGLRDAHIDVVDAAVRFTQPIQ